MPEPTSLTTLYCADWIVPVTSPAIPNGAIAISGDRILGLGSEAELKQKFPNARVETYQQSAIIPGLINAHSHLELTAMRGFLESVEHDFFAWLRKLTIARLERMTADDLYVSAAWGACEAVRAGVTAVGDASDAAETTLKALVDVGLSGTVFQESFGPDSRLAKDNFEKLRQKIAKHREIETSLVRVGVSPHAPYTVSPPQLELISRFAIEEKLPLMMHAAETQLEVALIKDGTGGFAEGLKTRGIEWQPSGLSPIQHLQQHGVLNAKPLLAHCIHVDEADIELLRHTQTRVAHCPKSNAKLGHQVAPLNQFIENDVVVALGSDSVASNNICDLFEESRFAVLTSRSNRNRYDGTNLSAKDALTMMTVNGASALGLAGDSGELKAGLRADFVVVGLAGNHQNPIYDPIDALIFSSSARDVLLTVIAGKEVYRDGQVKTVDESRLRKRMREIADKLVA